MLRNLFLATAILLAGAACEADAPPKKTETPDTSADALPDGKAIFRQHCVTCHGANGALGLNGAGDLTKSALALDQRVLQISKGKNTMPAFGEVLTPEEIQTVATFTETLKK